MMMGHMNYVNYIKYSLVFSVMHKLPQMLVGGQIQECDSRTGKGKYTLRPLLLGDKIAIVGASALLSRWLAPYLLYQDLNSMDILWRGDVDHVNYGNTARQTLIEYLL